MARSINLHRGAVGEVWVMLNKTRDKPGM